MSMHVFRRADGTAFERELSFAASEAARVVGTRYLIDGEEVVRDVQAEMALSGRSRAERTRELAKYPIVSHSLGCAPQRAPELRERLRKAVGFDCVRPDGKVIFESEPHRRAVAQHLGFVNTQSFYD